MGNNCNIRMFVAVAAVWGLGCGESPPEEESVTSALTSTTSTVRGYTRTDNANARLYISPVGGVVRELTDTSVTDIGRAQGENGPWGYVRSDHVNAVMYVSMDQHLHEIAKNGAGNTWVDTDFALQPVAAPLASRGRLVGGFSGELPPDAIGYVRTDGKNAIIYRGMDNHIYEVASNFGSSPPWVVSDLTGFTSAPAVGAGSAMPYIRSDSTPTNAIVYAASDGHIHEIASHFGQPHTAAWIDSDLFAASGATVSPSTDPWAYKRSDGQNAVIYVGSDGQLYELSLNPGRLCFTGKPWCVGIITAAQNPSGTFATRPSGYVRWDNLNAVVYLDVFGGIHELTLRSGGWVDGLLPFSKNGNVTAAIQQPFGHRAPASVDSVLFQGSGDMGTNPCEFSLASSTGSWSLNLLDDL